jgi:spermidine/putrescine ABC transporter ATP-binding subunit
MDDAIVHLDRVTKRFGPVEAVRDVSLAVRRGEFTSLLGPSGCGKSTILRMIAGFEPPDSGRIIIDGAEVGGVPPNRRPVNMVFQNYALFPHLTVFDNVAFGLRRKRVARAEVGWRTERFIALVGLEGLGDRYPSQLSGGQQQRVALARALVNQPKVLLLDEPLGALDLKLRKRMQVELKQLQREVGISFIYVTHDQDEALALSDTIAVMNRGALLQCGRGRDIYDRPRTEFVANFLGEANVIRARVMAREPDIVIDIEGQRVSVAGGNEAAAAIGEIVLLAVRPEHLVISAVRNSSDNVLICQVADKVFLGNSFLIHFRLGRDVALMARGVDRELFDSLELGGDVAVSWRPDQARLVTP